MIANIVSAIAWGDFIAGAMVGSAVALLAGVACVCVCMGPSGPETDDKEFKE